MDNLGFKTNELKQGFNPGDEIPSDIPENMIPFYLENQLGIFYKMNSGPGVDIPGLGVEIKSRINEAHAPHTIGTMNVLDILDAEEWKDTAFAVKFQRQYRVYWSRSSRNIIRAQIYKFDKKPCQEILANSYKYCRNKLIEELKISFDQRLTTIRCPDAGMLEYKPSKDKTIQSNRYAYRVDPRLMERLENISMSADTSDFLSFN